jgi:hypothetical protein
VATVPSLAEVRQWIGVPVAALSDEQLQRVYDAEIAAQAAVCIIPDDPDAYPAVAVEGLFRRVARVVAARGLPLGMMATESEYGPARLPSTDAEITRTEATIRSMVLG